MSWLSLAAILLAAPGAVDAATPSLERVTTIAPYPRGLAMVGGELFVLCRGRVRQVGGVTAAVDDQAGTIYAVDPDLTEPISGPVSDAIRSNGRVVARPATPPFRLWQRDADPPWSDRNTDRPYCTLRHHAASDSLFLCAFSGVDLPDRGDGRSFSKNRTDAVLRLDLRTGRWHEVDRHHADRGARYPHHDPLGQPPPHGWLNGPDNCLVVGDWLYVAAKDNSRIARYDLRHLRLHPAADALPSELVLDGDVPMADGGVRRCEGPSALAAREGWLYVGHRTSSEIIRFRIDEAGSPARPLHAELIALFDPFEPARGRSADVTDMAFDDDGRLYVVCAQPARIHRFTPDPDSIYDARHGRHGPWLDLAAATGNPRMKSENLLIDADRLFITAGDGYDFQAGAHGTVYRVRLGATTPDPTPRQRP